MNHIRSAMGLALLALSLIASACAPATSPGGDITGVTWQWSQLVETQPAAQSVVPDPENYTLIFNPDGSVSIKADCNMVLGSYTIEGGSLSIELGPSTLAFCGEQSSDVLYLDLLERVESYTVEDGRLLLNLKDGAGRMTLDRE